MTSLVYYNRKNNYVALYFFRKKEDAKKVLFKEKTKGGSKKNSDGPKKGGAKKNSNESRRASRKGDLDALERGLSPVTQTKRATTRALILTTIWLTLQKCHCHCPKRG